MTAPPTTPDWKTRLWESLVRDAGLARHGLVVNTLAGSLLVPRFLRYLLYRAAGMRIETPNIDPHVTFSGNLVSIGPKSYVNSGCYFETTERVSLGARCLVSMQVTFITATHDLSSHGRVGREPTGARIEIGDDCWIGARATILPGVTVGNGTVIAAGAVVVDDCEPRSVYGGVPAKLLRRLDDNGSKDETTSQ